MKNQLKILFITSIVPLSFKSKMSAIWYYYIDVFNKNLYFDTYSVTHSYQLLTHNL